MLHMLTKLRAHYSTSKLQSLSNCPIVFNYVQMKNVPNADRQRLLNSET